MNPQPQPFVGQGRVATSRPPNASRLSGEFRSPLNGHAASNPAAVAAAAASTNGHAPLAVPPPRAPSMPNGNHPPGFVGARSPPQQKNTSHVPCKFFRQGACQAGSACPFLHGETPQPCKYFQKGNCKFGLKCANDHITQDGRRVNKPGGYVMGPVGPLHLGGRVMPPPTGPAPANSLLTMHQDQFAQPQPIPGASSALDYMNRDMWRTDGGSGNPVLDSNFSSLPKSNYGSPTLDSNLLMSPSLRGIGTTAANAQLPASFDSQGISKYARDGPFAASVPSRFGLDSSPPSRPFESTALRNLHNSAFGDDPVPAVSTTNLSNGRSLFTSGATGSLLPSSPPADELLGRRILHSERYSRNSSTRMLSASVGARPPIDEWDDTFALEEEMVPNSLHDLLTPAEKARRFSRSADDELRPALSGLGTPAEATSKVGSPSTASPSRFGAFFAGRNKESTMASAVGDASPFGPVGSPLKNSTLNQGASPSLRATANARPLSGDLGSSIASPPRQASMSMISQQLQRTRLSDRVAESQAQGALQQQQLVGSPSALPQLQHPGITRVASGSSSSISMPPSSGAPAPPPVGRLDRAVSGSSNVGREKIDEEPEELFSMDELGKTDDNAVGGGSSSATGGALKRNSGGAWAQGNPFALGKASPRLGPIGGQRTAAKPIPRKTTGGSGED
ncbi:hypothetical protein, variant [Verruconis gallopava]|uniref:C3H1-type domain-containing protein n=1 Tax=Verruconis gallopava TaxID=253628 RepID=A0A0D1XL66_9PEZI|nr:uncharacterized protein PV09_05769 [Verruconis gallopava]XP_016212996.1 hypothetical protein, variant [Verruconis gallopava]KIW03126.1 hypothetical protein PV09_05769 [Verruconis gallopava]KIW03127.1 hypothetical protein, variant [Verruconis gallopava]